MAIEVAGGQLNNLLDIALPYVAPALAGAALGAGAMYAFSAHRQRRLERARFNQGADPSGCIFGREPLRVRLKWEPQAQFAGFYVADALGYYKEEGLSVEFVDVQPAPEHRPSIYLEHKLCPIAIAGPTEVIRATANAKGQLAVMTVFQKSPASWFSRVQHGISGPEDLKPNGTVPGRIVAVDDGSSGILDEYRVWSTSEKTRDFSTSLAQVDFDRMRADRLAHLTEAWILEVVLSGDRLAGMDLFHSGRVHLWQGYSFNEEALVRAQYGNDDIVSFNSESLGQTFCGDVVVVQSDFLKSRPDVVGGFVRASAKGWQFAVDPANERDVVDIVMAQGPRASREHQVRMLAQLRDFVAPERDLSRVGRLDLDVWNTMSEQMFKAGLIQRPVSADESVYADFANVV